MLKISFAKTAGTSDAVVVFYDENKTLFADNILDDATTTSLLDLLNKDDFKGGASKTITYRLIDKSHNKTVVVAGIGKLDEVKPITIQKIGANIISTLNGLQDATASIATFPTKTPEQAANDLATGILLKGYRFDKYITKERPDVKKPKINAITFLVKDINEADKIWKKTKTFTDSVYLARNLQNEPANILNPETYAAQIKETFAKLPVTVKVLGEAEMQKLGMGALLGVGQGSAIESQLVIMEYNGSTKKDERPVALVGKGVTFDTGGISIKPAANMEDMKWDMGGSAVVVSTLHLLATQNANINAVGVVGLVENMPSGTAQRPGDIVTSMSGQTIEVLNTDAEGRLVLADALWYAQEKYNPKTVIDFATLTGAIVVALGELTAGLFSNDDKLANALYSASKDADEPIWRLPLNEEYNKDMNSPVADMKNIGSGRGAGSITAAQFLQRFIKPDVAWAHVDIAGVTSTKTGRDLAPKGGNGFGVHLMERFFAAYSS